MAVLSCNVDGEIPHLMNTERAMPNGVSGMRRQEEEKTTPWKGCLPNLPSSLPLRLFQQELEDEANCPLLRLKRRSSCGQRSKPTSVLCRSELSTQCQLPSSLWSGGTEQRDAFKLKALKLWACGLWASQWQRVAHWPSLFFEINNIRWSGQIRMESIISFLFLDFTSDKVTKRESAATRQRVSKGAGSREGLKSPFSDTVCALHHCLVPFKSVCWNEETEKETKSENKKIEFQLIFPSPFAASLHLSLPLVTAPPCRTGRNKNKKRPFPAFIDWRVMEMVSWSLMSFRFWRWSNSSTVNWCEFFFFFLYFSRICYFTPQLLLLLLLSSTTSLSLFSLMLCGPQFLLIFVFPRMCSFSRQPHISNPLFLCLPPRFRYPVHGIAMLKHVSLSAWHPSTSHSSGPLSVPTAPIPTLL